jgi:predicted anti-sigma-YlaC factor YlaD
VTDPLSGLHSRVERRRRRRQAQLVRWALAAVLVVLVLLVGIAIGEALHDNPRPGGTITDFRTLPPPG